MAEQLVRNKDGTIIQKSNRNTVNLDDLTLKLVKYYLKFEPTVEPIDTANIVADAQLSAEQFKLDYFLMLTYVSKGGMKLQKVEPSVPYFPHTIIHSDLDLSENPLNKVRVPVPDSHIEHPKRFPDYYLPDVRIVTVNFYCK